PFLKIKIWAQGGSISFAMIPVFIVAFRWGLKGGLLTGLLYGLLQIPFGAFILTSLQALIEYVFAFTAFGFAGIFANQVSAAVRNAQAKQTLFYVSIGIFIGASLRFVGHFIAGVVFFKRFMPEGWSNIWIYSLVYNASYIVPSFVISSVALYFLFT